MQNRKAGNVQGIDVSHHQGTVNWTKVAADNIAFVFLKATEGQTYKDTTFGGHAKAAKAAGLMVGAYHFLRAASVDAAVLEARFFVNTVNAAYGADKLDFPLVMDYENNPNNLTYAAINQVSKAFLKEVERLTGRKPIIYTGNVFGAIFDADHSAYDLWIARYAASTPPADNKAWKEWDFWQYSDGQSGGTRSNSSRRVAGIGGPVDLNEFNGTLAQLKAKYAKQAPVSAEKPAPPTTTGKNSSTAAGDVEASVSVQLSNGAMRPLSTKGFVRAGVCYVPVGAMSIVTGKSKGYRAADQKAMLNEILLEGTVMVGNDAFAPTKEVAEALGMFYSWNNTAKSVLFLQGNN